MQSRFRLDDFELYKAARQFRRRVYELVRQLPSCEEWLFGESDEAG